MIKIRSKRRKPRLLPPLRYLQLIACSPRSDRTSSGLCLTNQPMKSLIYSITCLAVAALLSSCNTNKTETSTTTPASTTTKKETTKKSSTKKSSTDTTKKSTDSTKKESADTTKKETTKKEKTSPSPSPSATP